MKKVGYFFFCFLPLLVTLCLQFIVALPAIGFCLMQICFFNILSGTKISSADLMAQFVTLSETTAFSTMISILYAACGILLFGFWYFKQFGKDLRQSFSRLRNPALIISLILLVPGLQIVSGFLASLSASFFPWWMEFYIQLMESAGLSGQPSLPLILYAVILGPIAEELTFRGVIFSSAKRSLPFWAANLLQAFLFGVFHLNLIQGIYAFFLGLFLGYICGRDNGVGLPILLHILYNGWGVLIPTDGALYTNPVYSMAFLLLSIVLGVVGLILFQKNITRSAIKQSPDFSDI